MKKNPDIDSGMEKKNNYTIKTAGKDQEEKRRREALESVKLKMQQNIDVFKRLARK